MCILGACSVSMNLVVAEPDRRSSHLTMIDSVTLELIGKSAHIVISLFFRL